MEQKLISILYTKIRENELEVCQKNVSYDAKALYLWDNMQNMPTGSCTSEREETGFKKENSAKMDTETKDVLEKDESQWMVFTVPFKQYISFRDAGGMAMLITLQKERK